MNLLTIVVLSYNVKKYIKVSIDFILNQSYGIFLHYALTMIMEMAKKTKAECLQGRYDYVERCN